MGVKGTRQSWRTPRRQGSRLLKTYHKIIFESKFLLVTTFRVNLAAWHGGWSRLSSGQASHRFVQSGPRAWLGTNFHFHVDLIFLKVEVEVMKMKARKEGKHRNLPSRYRLRCVIDCEKARASHVADHQMMLSVVQNKCRIEHRLRTSRGRWAGGVDWWRWHAQAPSQENGWRMMSRFKR